MPLIGGIYANTNASMTSHFVIINYSHGDIMSSDICGNATLQSCPKRESVRIQFHGIASKGKVLSIQFSRIASKKCKDTTPQSSLK
jgi:hypothetical protein